MRRELAGPSCSATNSRRRKGDVVQGGVGLTVLELVGDYPKSQRLCFGHRLFCGGAVSQGAGQLGNLGDPPPVLFLLKLKRESHRHGAIVAGSTWQFQALSHQTVAACRSWAASYP